MPINKAKLDKISIADVRLVIRVLQEKEKLYMFGGNKTKVEKVNFEIQDLSDYLDERILDLDIEI